MFSTMSHCPPQLGAGPLLADMRLLSMVDSVEDFN